MEVIIKAKGGLFLVGVTSFNQLQYEFIPGSSSVNLLKVPGVLKFLCFMIETHSENSNLLSKDIRHPHTTLTL